MQKVGIVPVKKRFLPMEPPAEMEQYSNNPSKIGQSSPTLSVHQGYQTLSVSNLATASWLIYGYEAQVPTFLLFSSVAVRILRVDAVQEVDVFIRVELRHLPLGRRFCSLSEGVHIS